MTKANFVELVEKFMIASDQTVSVNNETQSLLYRKLINEEHKEVLESTSDENELKEICDLIWVAIGYGLSRGWNVNSAFAEVARSNMSKVGADGKVVKNEYGKVVKPEWYSPADVSSYLTNT